MNERYDYVGLPLNRMIARALILKLYSGADYSQTPEIRDEVLNYHLKHGGEPPTTLDMRRAVYKILRRFEEEGKALRRKYQREHQWKVLSSNEIRVGSRGRLVFSDNLNKNFGVPALEDESVALTFTSPPYWNFIDYEGGNGVGNREECYTDYLDSLEQLFSVIIDKTMPGGRFIVNVSNMKSRRAIEGDSFVYPIVSDVIRLSMAVGFTFFDEILWVKGGINLSALKGRVLFGSYPYPPTPKILDSMFENILVFTKPGKRKVCPEIKDRSRLTKEEWKEFTMGVWQISPDRDPDHPAPFPMKLAERIIRMYSFVDDIVLDPFAGSATALIACEKYDRCGVGFEISRAYEQAVRNKEAKWLNQLTLDF